MSQIYRLRKCFLERDQTPTQSLMKKHMSPALAKVYFKSMSPKLKVYAGLEPPLIGGGTSWYIPPQDLLQQRVILKPFKQEYMSKLTYLGVDTFGMEIMAAYRKSMEEERDKILLQSSLDWKQQLEEFSRFHKLACANKAATVHRVFIRNALREFRCLYSTSITKVEGILLNASFETIEKSREEIIQKMQAKYEVLLREQAGYINELYSKKLARKKARLKKKFRHELETKSKVIKENLHDLNIEKHVAIEKLRKHLECQTMASQVYVTLLERQECSKQIELIKRKHNKKTKILESEVAYKGFQIRYAQEKEKKQLEYEAMWKAKVAQVLKSFQRLISYCLHLLPEHAEFFINIEKLMLLQLEDALVCPCVPSIIIKDVESVHNPTPRPHPFYLLGDKNNKPNINQNLCPKHCTSSSSQLPVIVINKRCIYSACDNFEQLADKLKDFGYDRFCDDIQDNYDYRHQLPVKYTLSQQLLELQLESSLFQLLQQEIENARDVSIECAECNKPFCFCSLSSLKSTDLPIQAEYDPATKEGVAEPPLTTKPIQPEKLTLTDEDKVKFGREPKIQSYARFIKSKKCDCTKVAKKHLLENLPVYMRTKSIYDAPELLSYEVCTLVQLKNLVSTALGTMPKRQVKSTELNKEMGTQTSDYEFESLCICFSDDSIESFLDFLGKHASEPHLKRPPESIAKFDCSLVQLTRPQTPKGKTADVIASYFSGRSISRCEKDISCICPY